MVIQGILTSLLLPPLVLVLACLFAGLLAWRGRRLGGMVAFLAALALIFLATPFCASLLMSSLERDLAASARDVVAAPHDAAAPEAIIILGAEAVSDDVAVDIGPLTLERLRAGAALHRRTRLPILVTAGPPPDVNPALAVLMARSLSQDFGVETRWIEQQARDTHENAAFSVALLRQAGIRSAFVVSHAWHLPRARESFARLGFTTVAVPVRIDTPPASDWQEWIPRPDHWATSWYMLREWAGRFVYAIRD